jgi:heme O synthase-like polyprenyltransferase
MRGLFELLGARGEYKTVDNVTSNIETYTTTIVGVILGLCAFGVTLFAIYVGYRIAKAEDEGKRKEARNQLVYSLVALVGIGLIIVMITAVIPNTGITYQNSKTSGTGIEGLAKVYTEVESIVKAILNVIACCASIFAIYVGWQLMKAEDDGKRKQARMQLMYTIIGVVGVVLINVIASVILGALAGNAWQSSGGTQNSEDGGFFKAFVSLLK